MPRKQPEDKKEDSKAQSLWQGAKARYGHMGRLGWEEAKAYFRQGLAEIRNALYPSSNVTAPVDPGMYGVISHGEAADVRRDVVDRMSKVKAPGKENKVVEDKESKQSADLLAQDREANESVLDAFEKGRD